MREIKFRAWHKKRKKFYQVLHLHVETVSNGGAWVTCEGFNPIEQKEINIQIQPGDSVIEQYTGLRDMNGDEIYEGDVFEVTDGDGWVVGNMLAQMDGETFMTDQRTVGKRLGNIHQNPELTPDV